MTKTMTPGQENLEKLNFFLNRPWLCEYTGNKLNFFLNQPWQCEYAGNKSGYEAASIAFLRQLLKDVEQTLTNEWAEFPIADHEISFNPGCPGDAGDPSLYFITTWGTGIALHISEGHAISGMKLRCSEITSINDCPTSPKWLSVKASYESIVDSIVQKVTATKQPNNTALVNSIEQKMSYIGYYPNCKTQQDEGKKAA